MRPANIVTAFADILAGAAIVTANVTSFQSLNLFLLLISTAGLYGGGVVFNDYFDADLDKIERPERPIPSGGATLKNTLILGVVLFIIGIFSALMVSMSSAIIAALICLFAVLYDAVTKHFDIVGPLNMGLCRGLNLLLGMSLFPGLMWSYWYFIFIPVIFIAAITLISKGEVTGSGRKPLYAAAFCYTLIFVVFLYLGLYYGNLMGSLPFTILFAAVVFPPLYNAIQEPSALRIRKAVKMGILSLIILNAVIAALFAGFIFGVGILLLLPLSMYMGRYFAVT